MGLAGPLGSLDMNDNSLDMTVIAKVIQSFINMHAHILYVMHSLTS